MKELEKRREERLAEERKREVRIVCSALVLNVEEFLY
jgi:hypothetical protein